MDESPLTVASFDAHHDHALFSCREPSLDRYIYRQASQDARRRGARVFVASGDPPERIAYRHAIQQRVTGKSSS